MKLCLNTSTLASPADDRLSVCEKISLAAEAGFELLEPWNDELDRWVERGGDLAEIRARLADHGMAAASVISLRGWMEYDGARHDEAIADCRRRFAQAQAIGAPAIVASPPFSGDWHYDLDRGAERYAEILALGEEYGVRPLMEFLGFVPTIYLLEQAYAIAELTGHPDAAVVLDPFHLWRGGSGFGLIAHMPVRLVGVVHFNDAPADNPPRFEQRDADRVYPGDGCLPLVPMLRDLLAIGYDGPLSLELFNESYWAQDPAENLRRGAEATRAALAAAREA